MSGRISHRNGLRIALPDRANRKEVTLFRNSNGINEIEITSKHLVEVIKKVNKHPPLQPLANVFSEEEPYPTLFHHMDDIRKEVSGMGNEEADSHLEKLEKLCTNVEPIWNRARNIDFTENMISYSLLWTLFQPGDMVIREDDLGNFWLFVLIEITCAEIQLGPNIFSKDSDNVTTFYTWFLNWNEVDGNLTRKMIKFTCPRFFGRRHIKSLPVYPIRYQEGVPGENIRQKLTKRGRQWLRLMAKSTVCQYYSGPAFLGPDERSSFRRRDELRFKEYVQKIRVDSRVVIDESSKYLPINACLDVESCDGNAADYREEYQWDKLPLDAELSDEQAMLCPPIIGCYDLKSKELYLVSVDNLRPVKWNENAMDHLVLDPKKKNMLTRLVRYHSHRHGRNGEKDLIAGKGQSLAILLHGPPGVGKTLTAESTAETMKKPLVSLSIGEMVWNESNLQSKLETEFKRAKNWDAVLLLDEADVVLEARSFEDVRRNGIVSIFLRQLEYFQGILFLTTNRISTMDVAFQSRIQVGIGFQEMTPTVRAQICTQLLALNGRDQILGPEAVDNIRRKLSKSNVNGRQIRNILNVADGLAFEEHNEEGRLEYKHIDEALQAALEFQKLLEDAKSRMKLEQTVWAPYNGGDGDSAYM
ncbi:P-loop containing nucleoside triphosphate hydrolase protein [Trichoderma chlorosporum]